MPLPDTRSFRDRHRRGTVAAARIALASIALLSGAAAFGQVPDAPSPAAGIRSLTGTWRVVAVTVADSPVQALVADDPSYMGAILDVTPARLSWRRPHKASSLSDTCARPRLTGGAITCRGGPFGPPGARATRSGKRLSIGWYDGGTLILQRVR